MNNNFLKSCRIFSYIEINFTIYSLKFKNSYHLTNFFNFYFDFIQFLDYLLIYPRFYVIYFWMKSITKLLLLSSLTERSEAIKNNAKQRGGNFVDEFAQAVVDLNIDATQL